MCTCFDFRLVRIRFQLVSMGLLASCWCIVESMFVVDGSRRWIFLSFYIHPPLLLFLFRVFLLIRKFLGLILFLFRIFSRARQIIGLIIAILHGPASLSYFIFSYLYRQIFTSIFVSYLLPGSNNTTDHEKQCDTDIHVSAHAQGICPLISGKVALSVTGASYEPENSKLHLITVYEKDEDYREDSPCFYTDDETTDDNINEYTSDLDSLISDVSDHGSEELALRPYQGREELSLPHHHGQKELPLPHHHGLEELPLPPHHGLEESPLPTDANLGSPYCRRDTTPTDQQGGPRWKDPFYEVYTERMRWFDMINHEMTCGIAGILNKQPAGDLSTSLKSIENLDFFSRGISYSKIGRKRLMDSLTIEFELVYVAQICLSWEALYYHYNKIKASMSSATSDAIFREDVAGRFQNFQVVLERFMDDEKSGGRRIWNYVRARLTDKTNLLQVPEISGYNDEEEEENNAEGTNASKLLNGVEECIKAFWIFLTTEERKPTKWEKFRSFMWDYPLPSVEDPRDLRLFYELRKSLKQQEVMQSKELRNEQKGRLLKKGADNPLFSTIEMLSLFIQVKLVSRVLKMPMLASAHLNWCRNMLSSLLFQQRNRCMASTMFLFPSHTDVNGI